MGTPSQVEEFSKFIKVSRETTSSLIEFEKILLKTNQKLNLIGKSTEKDIWNRHFLDSAQIIDFINKNDSTLIDLGTGAGFPGIIISILAKDRKIPLQITLIEKSVKKAVFLNKIIDNFGLNVSVLNKNLFSVNNNIQADVIVARAFKPTEEILEILSQKIKNWKKTLIFLGKTWKQELFLASKKWDLKYKQTMSITSSDSAIIEISKLEKKN